VDSRQKAGNLRKLFAYSILYGLFSVNYIDLAMSGSNVPGYHLWLLVSYFAPFVPLLLFFGLQDWELVASLGLTASLMNDLFYYPVGMLMFQRSVNLGDWYSQQLGLKGLSYAGFMFDVGSLRIPVMSWMMGLTIYLRIVIIVALTIKLYGTHSRASSS
jgi:hypothetical protein